MKKYFILFLAVFLGFTFWSAGMVKLFEGHLFIGWIGPPDLVEQLQRYNLELFGKFIAISQVFIGYLMLTNRFKLLGSIMLVPMILCILFFTISQQWRGTPYILGILLAMDLAVLGYYRRLLIPLYQEESPLGSKGFIKKEREKSTLGNLVWTTGLILQFVAIGFSGASIRTAFFISGAGLFISIFSFKLDRTTPKGSSHESISLPEF